MPINVNVDEYSSSVAVNADGDEIVTVEITEIDDPIDITVNSGFVPHTHDYSDLVGLGEDIQDVIGGMIESNTEAGLSVTYDDTTGKLNFDVNDPTFTLTGDVSGTATMVNLGNVSIDATVANDSHSHTINTITNFENETKTVIRNMTYVHTQASASASWTIIHNLGYFPSIEIIDSAGSAVVGDYQYVDVNTITATFTSPFAGKAYLS